MYMVCGVLIFVCKVVGVDIHLIDRSQHEQRLEKLESFIRYIYTHLHVHAVMAWEVPVYICTSFWSPGGPTLRTNVKPA